MADENELDKTADDAGGSEDEHSDNDEASDDDLDKDASSGDVAGKKGDDDSKSKSGRAGERIRQLSKENKDLKERGEDLTIRLEALEAAVSAKKSDDSIDDKKAENAAVKRLKKMGYSDEQIEAATLIYQSVAEQSESETKKQLAAVEAKLAANEEKESLSNAIIAAEKDGIEVTPKQIAEFRKQCMNSTDPREQLLAEAPYGRIIKMMLMDGVIEKKAKEDTDDEGEEDKAKKKEPKIPSGQDSRKEKRPTNKTFKYDPGNAMSSMDALERRVLANVAAEDE
jgi:hypothetical protein